MPDAELDEFVAGIAARMGGFPRDALIAAKTAINAVSLPTPANVRADAALFPHSQLHLLTEAGHYVQVDEPDQVAHLIVAE